MPSSTKITAMLNKASLFADKGDPRRHYFLGAVGIRSDGIIVTARNGSCRNKTPQAHAEARLAKKLTPESIVFVSRTLKTGGPAMAKPCFSCRRILKSVGVSVVYYSCADGFEMLEL